MTFRPFRIFLLSKHDLQLFPKCHFLHPLEFEREKERKRKKKYIERKRERERMRMGEENEFFLLFLKGGGNETNDSCLIPVSSN